MADGLGLEPCLIDLRYPVEPYNVKVTLRIVTYLKSHTTAHRLLVVIDRVELSLVSYEPTAGTTPYHQILDPGAVIPGFFTVAQVTALQQLRSWWRLGELNP